MSASATQGGHNQSAELAKAQTTEAAPSRVSTQWPYLRHAVYGYRPTADSTANVAWFRLYKLCYVTFAVSKLTAECLG